MQTTVKCITKGKTLIDHKCKYFDCIYPPIEQGRAFPNCPRLLTRFAEKGGCHG